MTDIIVDIMVEVLRVLAMATQEVKRGRISKSMSHRFTIFDLTDMSDSEKYFRKLAGSTDIEDSLQRLDELTQEEARMASAEQLKVTNGVDAKVIGVDDKVKGVEEKVDDVHGDVQDIGNHVQDVGNEVRSVERRVQDVHDDVQYVGNMVQDIDDRAQGINDNLEQVDRS
jgi:DNA repair ATPase RecN